MTLQLIDGFDLYNGTGVNTGLAARWTVYGTFGVYGLAAGRFSPGQCLTVSSSNPSSTAGIFRAMPVGGGSGSFGFAFKNSALVNTLLNFAWIGIGTTPQFGLSLSSTGAITVNRGNLTAALGASPNGVILPSTWQYIEVEWTLSTTAGVVNVWVDGVRVLALSGLNNAPAGLTGDNVVFSHAGASVSFSIDDVYSTVGAATRLGEARVETLRPSADTATKNWTPKSGTANFSQVNETLCDGDTSYISATTVGTADLYDIADLSATSVAVFAVQLTSFVEKTDSASRAIVLTAKSGATSLDSATIAMPAAYNKFDAIFATDPNTSAAWTPAAVNALQIGPKVAV